MHTTTDKVSDHDLPCNTRKLIPHSVLIHEGKTPDKSYVHPCQNETVCGRRKRKKKKTTPTRLSFTVLCLSLVAQLCLILCDPMDCSPPGSYVLGILQARILELVAILSFRGYFPPTVQMMGWKQKKWTSNPDSLPLRTHWARLVSHPGSLPGLGPEAGVSWGRGSWEHVAGCVPPKWTRSACCPLQSPKHPATGRIN